MRDAFFAELTELAHDDRVWALTGDLGIGLFDDFAARAPGRYLNVGIAEQNLVGVAAGLAYAGAIPFAYSIAPFITSRAHEQVRVDVAIAHANVKLVGVGGGVAYGYLGPTHHGSEDVAVMRALPGLTVLTPGDPGEARAATRAAAAHDGPVYLRLGKNGEPGLLPPDSFELGRATRVRGGSDVTIASCGTILAEALKAADELASDGIEAEVLHYGTVKPFDADALGATGALVTLEEHSRSGGLGSAAAESIAERGLPVRLRRLGLDDTFAHAVGSREHLLERYGCAAVHVAAAARELLGEARVTALARQNGARGEAADAVYREAIEKEFAFLKGTSSIADLHARAIVLPDERGLLVPVCELHADDLVAIERFACWREENAHAFPVRFQVTLEGTARWLRNAVLDVPDRILFLVLDRHGNAIGHLGFAGCLREGCRMEIDNVVRGEVAAPGLMGVALDALCEWAEDMFAPAEIHLRVLDDNAHAISFYARRGFVESGAEPLDHGGGFVCMTRLPPPVDPEEFILTAGPMIGAREASYALDATRTGWNTRHSGYLSRFEKAFAEYVGCRYTLATSSCTGALHIALLALGIGPGDEVIVPDLTWVASASAIAYTGATPIFADVQPESWCIDPASAASLIGEATRAILPVHMYGHPADMDAILALAAEHDLHVLEDAAPAIGAEVRGRRVGALGDAGAFSFQGAKLLVAGEGGMFCTDDEQLYERARVRWLHGCTDPDRFWISELGVKYRMSNVQAAVGLGQLERVEELVDAKRRIFGWYEEEFDGVEGVSLNREADWARSIYWMPSLLLDERLPLDRDELRRRLKSEHGVDSRSVFPALSSYPIWGAARTPMPVADRIGRRALNLPSGVRLRRGQVARVGAAIRAELARLR